MEQTSSLMSNLYSLSDADANTKLRLGTATVSDQRISLMNQVVSGIGTVKMHAWEDEYGQKIKHIRR